MGPFTKGAVVLVPFPFSNLTQAKMRPAVVLAHAGQGDYILCQITSNPYADTQAVKLENADCRQGSLQRVSYARPGKLFTAHETLFASAVGKLEETALKKVVVAVIDLLKQ